MMRIAAHCDRFGLRPIPNSATPALRIVVTQAAMNST